MIDNFFGHIHCLPEIKQTLIENIVLPFKFPQLFQGARHGIRSILLFGVTKLLNQGSRNREKLPYQITLLSQSC